MTLHRDIFWVGKQWAVTGYGMQAVDQKQKSKFDIEASRLWEDDLVENLSGQRWFNSEDFTAGLSVARARYPEAPEKAASRKKAAAKSAPTTPPRPAPKAEVKAGPKIEPGRSDAKAETAKTEKLEKTDTKAKAAKPQASAVPATPSPKFEPSKPAAAPPPKLAFTPGPAPSALKIKTMREKKRPPAQFSMRVVGWPAKFTKMWRVRISRK